MRVKWAMLLVVVCVALAASSLTGCGTSETGLGVEPGEGPAGAVEEQRPTEPVEPSPEVNPSAVVWRTPEPPASPQAADVWLNPRDGMEMVYVPAGEFTLGSSDAELDAWLRQHPQEERSSFYREQPQCRVNLPAYWIGRTEVTNAQYLVFVRATGHQSPEHWASGRPPAGLENFPVVKVSWEDARAYCAWAGGRLPTELEWEKAARGTDGRIFPWGNAWDRAKCRNFGGITGRSYASNDEFVSALAAWSRSHDRVGEGPAAVGSYPSGASRYGCQDMAGNVWEWCRDWYEEDAYRRYATGDLALPTDGVRKVVRAGSWGNDVVSPRNFRCACRFYAHPDGPYNNNGFRCVRDLP